MKDKSGRALIIAACSSLAAVPLLSTAAPALEEIIVTAEKRVQSLQDVPISIVAFTQENLEKLSISDIKGLAAQVPNVLINEFTGSSTTVRLFIRGVGQNDVQVTQDPSVALYMDGVYIGSSVGTAFETADIQRIEILRGPQGTLYGRNATGGAINLITHEADPAELHFKQTIKAGNLGLIRSRSILNVPIDDSAAVKLAYSTAQRDGFVHNRGNGKDWGIEDRDNFTADFHWSMTDRQVLNYKYENSSMQDTSRLSQALGFDAGAPAAFVLEFANPDLDANGNPVEATDDLLDDATAFDTQQKGDVQINAHTLTFEWELNDVLSFKSITGYRDVNAFTQNSQTPTTSLNGTYSVTNGLADTHFNQFTQEFQLLGDGDTVTWVGGLFYYEDDAEQDQSQSNSNGSEAIADGELVDFTATENTSIAVFGQATWSPAALAGRWHFTLGARYSDDNRKAHRDNNRVSYGFGGTANNVPPFTANYDEDFDKFNPSFTVEYDLNEYSNVYGKVVTAYKSGGTSQRSTSSSNFKEGFEEEDLVSYELGYKGDMASGRLRVNAALFYMEYDDYQQSVATGNNAGERDFINIDNADIYGLELDLTFAIAGELTATLSYGYLDTGFGPETVSYLALDASSPDGTAVITDQLTDDLALAPQHSATAALDYNHPWRYGLFAANLNAQYQDNSNSGVVVPSGYLDDRTLVGATLGVSNIPLGNSYGQLKIFLWGKNLLDEEYFIGNIRQTAFDTLGLTSGVGTFGDPRTYGVTLEYEYF